MFRAIRVARRMGKGNVPIPVGECVKQVRLTMGIPAGGDFDGDGDSDAVDAWMRSRARVPLVGQEPIPRGVVVIWLGGSQGHGHAAISTGWGRNIWSPGTPSEPSRWRKVNCDTISNGWFRGTPPVGYMYDLNGHPVPDVHR